MTAKPNQARRNGILAVVLVAIAALLYFGIQLRWSK